MMTPGKLEKGNDYVQYGDFYLVFSVHFPRFLFDFGHVPAVPV